ncbi:MAG: hypothetical protein ACLQLC_08235 [Candidatus Sulfotelmatobacter sp.]
MSLRRKTNVTGMAANASLVLTLIFAASIVAAAQTAVTTYHNDTYRTGWNSNETTLTPANVNAAQFGLLATVAVDDQVDAQPLVVPNVTITAGVYQGVHDVVYIVTGNDTVYAIDANSGTILLSQNLGTPVSEPLGCNNNGPNVGITSTPVIDLGANNIYVIAYVQGSTGPAYYVHALDLGNLTDKITPQLVSASHTLSNGSAFNFSATYQRQRPGLLEANGNIYAGFGSFCDYDAGSSRGWLLGWSSTTLEPLASNQVFDTLSTSQDNFFLSSIWMSGYGLALDASGNVVFVTGNSDYSGNSYTGTTNIQESTIKVSSDLSEVVDLFTPADWASLDEYDTDFGSGGVLVLPEQTGTYPHLAVAAGKNGLMFLMNEDSLGGYSGKKNNVLGTYNIGGCWCGESYYVDPTDGSSRVVSSGGNSIYVWKLETTPTTKLVGAARSAGLSTGQSGGFFTSVSSNGTASPIIWALTRPTSQLKINLIAFNPDARMQQLFHTTAGTWPNLGGDSNQVPTVANGKVYVASYKELKIYGLTGTKK